MLSSATKRFSLPFSPRQTSSADAEAAAAFAVAEIERNKGGGLFTRQPEEKLVLLSKGMYPLWLYPKNDLGFVFDGFADTTHGVAYFEIPPAKPFMESLEANSRPREKFMAFLLDHGNYFQQSIKEKQFLFRGLLANLDFKGEFNGYRKEASETIPQNSVLLSPTLDENTISSLLVEFEKLQLSLRQEAEMLPECIRLVNKMTGQYVTEIDYEASASTEETDAKIKAQEELVRPKVAKLNKDYKAKMKVLTESFDNELDRQQKLKIKTQKQIESTEEKIRLYQRDSKDQGAKNHAVYEKRWKEKIKQTQKELNSLKKELKNIENKIKKLNKQKAHEITQLNFGLDAEIKFARQPLVDLEVAREAKILAFKMETNKLLKQEKPVLEGLIKSVQLREAVKASFDALGSRELGLKTSVLFYVSFYVVCYEIGASKRYLIIPPSIISGVDFSSKLKSAFGMSKTKNILTPRFKTITALIDKVQVLTKQNAVFENQLNSLMQKNNLLNNSFFLESVKKGLVYLKGEGWLSEKEHQVLSNRLTV